MLTRNKVWPWTLFATIVLTTLVVGMVGMSAAHAKVATEKKAMQGTDRTVTVTGLAREYLPVSNERLTISINEQRSSIAQLAQQLEKVAKVIDSAWVQHHIAQSAIRLHSLTIWSQQNHLYNASLQLSITTATMQECLQALTVADQWTTPLSPTLTFEDHVQQVAIPTQSLQSHMLHEAFADAREQAQQLAQEADERVGAVVNMRTFVHATANSQQELDAASNVIGGVQVMPSDDVGTDAIVSSVTVTYQLLPPLKSHSISG